MKRSGLLVCLGAVAALGFTACSGDDGGEDVQPDVFVPDVALDTSPNDPGTVDPGTVDLGQLDTPSDPGEAPDTVEPDDPGAQPDTASTDTPGSDAAEDVQKPTSRGCIGCHTNQALLKELAPGDGVEPAGGGG